MKNLTIQRGIQIQFDLADIGFVSDKRKIEYEIVFHSKEIAPEIFVLRCISLCASSDFPYTKHGIKVKAESIKVEGFGLYHRNAHFLN